MVLAERDDKNLGRVPKKYLCKKSIKKKIQGQAPLMPISKQKNNKIYNAPKELLSEWERQRKVLILSL